MLEFTNRDVRDPLFMKIKMAIKKINEHGVLLVFPHNNRPMPMSLWSAFYPRTKLRWEWDEDGDDRVSQMWRLMKQLSCCRDVVYSKWHGGRATFFSRELFTAMLTIMMNSGAAKNKLSREAGDILDELKSNSPLSTRDVKKLTNLQGKLLEGMYNRAMKELFSRLLIVGFGEVDDGAFPSLAIGATQLIYEELWNDALELDIKTAQHALDHWMPEGSDFRMYFNKILHGPRPANIKRS